jgi:hypothetical protein
LSNQLIQYHQEAKKHILGLNFGNTVRLTPIGNPVTGYQEILVAPNKLIVGLVKIIRSPIWGIVWR